MNCHGEIAQVDHEFVVPRVPSPSEFGALLLARAQPVERALPLSKQRAVLTQMRELQYDVRRPKARGPCRDRIVVDVYGRLAAGLSGAGAGTGAGAREQGEGERHCGGYEVVRAEVGELLEVVEGEH